MNTKALKKENPTFGFQVHKLLFVTDMNTILNFYKNQSPAQLTVKVLYTAILPTNCIIQVFHCEDKVDLFIW